MHDSDTQSPRTAVSGPMIAAPFGAGALAGFIAGIPMLAVLMAAGALADAPTAKPGVDTSLVTMPNAVTSFVFDTGLDQFFADYRWLTYPGIAIHLIVATVFGAVGLALVAAATAGRPSALAGAGAGALYGALLQVTVLFGFVSGLQDVDTVQTSVPIWGWWAAHVLYGALLGLIGAPLVRRAAAQADALVRDGGPRQREVTGHMEERA